MVSTYVLIYSFNLGGVYILGLWRYLNFEIRGKTREYKVGTLCYLKFEYLLRSCLFRALWPFYSKNGLKESFNKPKWKRHKLKETRPLISQGHVTTLDNDYPFYVFPLRYGYPHLSCQSILNIIFIVLIWSIDRAHWQVLEVVLYFY